MLTGEVDFYEFKLMYLRCANDQTGFEPRSLYNVVLFLMYLKSDKGDNFSYTGKKIKKTKITVEDTLEVLYVRY
jgi:calmodulin